MIDLTETVGEWQFNCWSGVRLTRLKWIEFKNFRTLLGRLPLVGLKSMTMPPLYWKSYNGYEWTRNIFMIYAF